MRVFLSYSSKQKEVAEEICLALEQDDHRVFFDKKVLRAGGDFRKGIREGLDASEVFVFLISPDAVAPGSYARSELDIARQKWPQPTGHVLPVMAVPTNLKCVPAYLRTMSILESEGDVVEAVSRALSDWSPLEEVDQVEDARRQLVEAGVSPALAGFMDMGVALGAFMLEVVEKGEPNKTYRRRLRGIVKGVGPNARFEPELTEYRASTGRTYDDEQGRKCREVTVTHRRDDEWITSSEVFHLERGRWKRDQPEQ